MHPAQGIVLAPAVVVAPLAALYLIAHQQHWSTCREQQGGEHVAHLALTQVVDGLVGGGAFNPVVPAVVVGVAVAVVFAIGEVVFAVVADQIVEGEAVMGGDEMNALAGGCWLAALEIGAGNQPLGHRPGGVVIAFPEPP